MTVIKNIAYAGAGEFAFGTITSIGLLCGMTFKAAGPGLAFIPWTLNLNNLNLKWSA